MFFSLPVQIFIIYYTNTWAIIKYAHVHGETTVRSAVYNMLYYNILMYIVYIPTRIYSHSHRAAATQTVRVTEPYTTESYIILLYRARARVL